MAIEGTAGVKIDFFRHDLGQAELDAVAEVLRGSILTTGATVAEFESRFAEFLGRKHCLGTTSCTGALHLSLLALGIGPGDEVITTPLTFAATSTAILEAGARPVFVDVEPETGNLDAERIATAITGRTKAILPVHLYGLMCDMRRIAEIAHQHQLRVIEDAAHCIEGSRDGIKPGELSDTACFSFYATKNMTCGEGGAVVTDDPELAAKLRLLRLHGVTKTADDRYREGYEHWDLVDLGWKYNMDNIQAALLLPQMERIHSNLQKRKALASYYLARLSEVEGVEWPHEAPNAEHCRHLFTILLPDGRRDAVIDQLKQRGIPVVVNYQAIHLLSYFRTQLGYQEGHFPVAEAIGRRTISLPFYPNMPYEHVDHVVAALSDILRS